MAQDAPLLTPFELNSYVNSEINKKIRTKLTILATAVVYSRGPCLKK